MARLADRTVLVQNECERLANFEEPPVFRQPLFGSPEFGHVDGHREHCVLAVKAGAWRRDHVKVAGRSVRIARDQLAVDASLLHDRFANELVDRLAGGAVGPYLRQACALAAAISASPADRGVVEQNAGVRVSQDD